jgi:hypothetical protein
VPPPATSGIGHAIDTDEGRRVRSLLMHYRKAGVTATELGRVLDVSGSHIGKITGQQNCPENDGAPSLAGRGHRMR